MTDGKEGSDGRKEGRKKREERKTRRTGKLEEQVPQKSWTEGREDRVRKEERKGRGKEGKGTCAAVSRKPSPPSVGPPGEGRKVKEGR